MKDFKKKEVIIGKIYEEEDYIKLKEIYKDWKLINTKIKNINDNTRSINLPEIVSEGIYSYCFDCIRTNISGSSSADLITKKGDKVQVKAATIEKDLTSFGPKSEWDILVFMDFSILDEVTVYTIPSDNIYNTIVNEKKKETFKAQQEQGRRPRLSIKKIIQEKEIEPIKKINLK